MPVVYERLGSVYLRHLILGFFMSVPASPRPRHRARKVIAACILLAVVGAGTWRIAEIKKQDVAGGPRMETVPVSLATIGRGDIDIIDPALGTVTPLASVTVRTQINGQLQEIAFQEGQTVQKGDYLAQIDPRPYQMTLEQAQGALQRDMGLLKDAQLNLARYEKLYKQNSISQQQLDTQASLVQQYQGNVVTDQGQIDAAKLNIAYCHITAPIGGRVGLRQVDAGNYVQTSDTNGIVSVTQLDPISVVFTIPEDRLPPVMKRFGSGAEIPVTAFGRAGTTKIAEGKLLAIDNEINTSTGTVKLRAQFDNADNALFPNQFVNVQVKVDTIRNALTAPQAGILRGTAGTFVYLAKDDGTVAMRPVKLGASQDDRVEVLEGLAEGDKIVTEGTDKLRDDAKYRLPGQEPSFNEQQPKRSR